MIYYKRYVTWLEKAGVDTEDLPYNLITLIDKFEHALGHWEIAPEDTQLQYVPILEQTDAYLSATIYQRFRTQIESAKLSKAKLLALKAKALNINLND